MPDIISAALQPQNKTVAVMQPYFFPYLGYFSLMARADEFVVLDCVQFPRRGRVHRTQITQKSDRFPWLTLPLKKQSRDTKIYDLTFATDAQIRWEKQRASSQACKDQPAKIGSLLDINTANVCDYLVQQLTFLRDAFGLRCTITRSSTLAVDHRLAGQEKIIAITQSLNANTYINAPAGRALYQSAKFEAHGIALRFLPPYHSPFASLLPALATTSFLDLSHALSAYSSLPLENANG